MISLVYVAQSEHFENLTSSWLLTLDDLQSKFNLFSMLSWSYQIWAKSEHFENLTPSWPLTLNDLKSKFNLFRMFLGSFISNLCPITAFWKSGPKLRLNDHKIISDQKFLYLKETSGQGSLRPCFMKTLSNYVDDEAFWTYSNNYPKWPLDDLWPQILEHSNCPPPTPDDHCTKYHENWSVFKRKHFLIVNG